MGPAGGWRTLAFNASGSFSRTGLSRILIESPVAGCAVSSASASDGREGAACGAGAGCGGALAGSAGE